MAPALTIGLKGRLSLVSRIEWKASPLGSTPIVADTRLDREWHGAVADLVNMAVDGDETDTEMIGVGPLQLGDVIGYRARVVRPDPLVAVTEETLQRWLGGITGGPA